MDRMVPVLGRSRAVVGLALASAWLVGCGSSREVYCPQTSPRITAPTAGTGQDLIVDRDPVLFQLVTAPEFALRVEEPGAYQIDALGTLDPVLTLHQGERLVASDDDGGEGDNARIVVSLEPGLYTIRVRESEGRGMVVQLQARRLPAMPPPPVLAPGRQAAVEVLAGDDPQMSTREVTLSIPAAGLYQIDASAPGRDAELALLLDGREIARDSDSGDGLNARVLARLDQGTYQVRVWEYGRNEATVTVAIAEARAVAQPPLEPVGVLSVDQPMTVEIGPANEALEGTRAIAFTVTEAGTFQLDAVAPDGQDPELALLEGGVELGRDSDGGGGYSARLVRHLQPGEYQLRVWEYQHRGARITVSVTRQ